MTFRVTPMSLLQRIYRFFYLCLALYIAISVLYTSAFLVFCPLLADCSTALALRIPKIPSMSVLLPKGLLRAVHAQRQADASQQDIIVSHLDAITANSMLSWSTPAFSLDLDAQKVDDLGETGPFSDHFSMPESLFLSKAFSNSMHPMKIIPFFYRASELFDEDDITVTTLVTSNRFEILRKLAQRYDGPLSVTIHIPFFPDADRPSSSSLNESLTALHTLILRTPALSARADIHLVLSPFPRAFNTWRNLARLLARTVYVLLLDVDFAICTQWRVPVRTLIRAEDGEMARRMREGSAALVIPAFEYVRADEGRDQGVFPRDKRTLLGLVRARKISPFHASWAPGHNSTDYKRFYAARQGEIYKVTQYQAAYEPYVIVKKDAGGWCDERFMGYGGNKAACLFEMYLSGVSFYVLGDHFLVHQSHPYEEEARKSERKYNRKIYADFKEETCLKYLIRFKDEGVLNTTRGHNVQEECKKIKGVSKIILQLLEG